MVILTRRDDDISPLSLIEASITQRNIKEILLVVIRPSVVWHFLIEMHRMYFYLTG